MPSINKKNTNIEKIEKSNTVITEEKEYTMQYYIKGILAVIMEWVNKGCQDDIEKITNIIIKCTLTKTKK